MAHIADFMLGTKPSIGLNNYIARELSPSSRRDEATAVVTPADEEIYVWRMHPTPDSRRYQLFPAKGKPSTAAGRRSPDTGTMLASTIAQAAEKGGAVLGVTVRTKPKEQTLGRRRKVSVPELGPMTTVQEVSMDSPTIPGRPPLHERSVSAPGNSGRQQVCGESVLSCIPGPALDEKAKVSLSDTPTTGSARDECSQYTTHKQESGLLKQPLSPRILPSLVIPSSTSAPQRLIQQDSTSRLGSGSTPPDVPPKSARMKEDSPHPRASPFTPMSASSTSLSTSTAPTSVSNTPKSDPEGRSSPKPWSSGPSPNPSPMGHSRWQSETTNRQKTLIDGGHRRGESEASIMNRGRPKKRCDGSPIRRTPSQRAANSEEIKAFETLPQGYRAVDAPSMLPASEIEILRKQALGQASRFEVLTPRHVENLSRELRSLDERCEYLRTTHRSFRSLRSGRRNLHDRICSYLRSPRVARFSHDAILKQEKALSELDSSIDDLVSELEQAENRRTRIRQKLLEHVAAALIIQPAGPATATATATQMGDIVVGERKAMAMTPSVGENTPPRSPTKTQSRSHSPQMLAPPVPVPVSVQVACRSSSKSFDPSRYSAESIRIYADSDVYALLADIEEEINRMGDQEQDQEQERSEVATATATSQSQSQAHEAAVNNSVGFMLTAATFSPQKPVGYSTAAF